MTTAAAHADELRNLLAAGNRFIDLRSPGEFDRGAVPGAVNLPILGDEERHQVGLTYREQGQAAAIAVGHELVSGHIRAARVDAWQQFAEQHPNAWFYCWRGGLRSEIAQSWLEARGIRLPRVPGGFKALRHCCLEALRAAPGRKPWYVLGGRTGTGKTVLLNRFAAAIDLEGLANHRGSAFGGTWTPQPPPITFENALAVAWLRHNQPWVLLEDESRTIGRLGLPPEWHAAMQRAPLIILEADLATRARHIQDEYVYQPLAAGIAASTLLERLRHSLQRIGKRLGGQRKMAIETALIRGFETGDHLHWIEQLLTDYYDPMYDFQLAKKDERVLFRGAMTETEAFLTSLTGAGEAERSRRTPEDQ